MVPNENDFTRPGIAMANANTEIHALFDRINNNSKKTTTLKIKITQKARPNIVVHMKFFGLT